MMKLFRRSRLMGLAVALVVLAPALGASAQASTATVVSPQASVYSAPSTGAFVVDVLVREEVVTLAGFRTYDARWVKVVLADGRLGWMETRSLWSEFRWGNLWVEEIEYAPVSPEVLAQSMWSATVRDVRLRLRRGPGEAHPIITTLSPGQVLEMLGRSGDGYWIQVRLPEGTVGWVFSRYLDATFPITYLPVVGDTRGADATTATTGTLPQQGGYTPPAAAVGGPNTYVVKTGDTLFSIALSYGMTTDMLAAYNGIIDPNYIQVGQVIYIP